MTACLHKDSPGLRFSSGAPPFTNTNENKVLEMETLAMDFPLNSFIIKAAADVSAMWC